MLIGDLLANTGLAVANYVKGTGTPYFVPIIAADDLTPARADQERDPRRRLHRQRVHPSVGRLGAEAGATSGSPPSARTTPSVMSSAAVLPRVFTEGGGEIVQQFWHPLNTADFSPYLGQLADLKVDAIFAMETGADFDPAHPAIFQLRPEGEDAAYDGNERHRTSR